MLSWTRLHLLAVVYACEFWINLVSKAKVIKSWLKYLYLLYFSFVKSNFSVLCLEFIYMLAR